MRTLHLFAGAGGGLLADIILGHEPVCAVEWEPYACQALREGAAEGWFPCLHVHEGDVRLFDPSPWAGRVDCVHAGFPCQDLSVAGKRAGIHGERSGLFFEVVRIVRHLRPEHLLLENVPGVLPFLGTVLGALAEIGYDARWTCLSAYEVGAPHIRDRWWCYANPHAGHEQPEDAVRTGGGSAYLFRPDLPDNPQHGRGPGREGGFDPSGSGEHEQPLQDVADTDEFMPGHGHDGACEAIWPAEAGDERRRDTSANTDYWLTEPDVGRVAHGVASRVDRLKALGNGQVPLQAAAAWMILTGGMK